MDTKGNEVINALANYFKTDYDTVEKALGNLIDSVGSAPTTLDRWEEEVNG